MIDAYAMFGSKGTSAIGEKVKHLQAMQRFLKQ